MTSRKACSDQIEALTKRAEAAEAKLAECPWCSVGEKPTLEKWREAIEERDNLRAKLAEAQKDTERLEKLIEVASNARYPAFDKEDLAWEILELLHFKTTQNGISHDTPRAAIDAAKGKV